MIRPSNRCLGSAAVMLGTAHDGTSSAAGLVLAMAFSRSVTVRQVLLPFSVAQLDCAMWLRMPAVTTPALLLVSSSCWPLWTCSRPTRLAGAISFATAAAPDMCSLST
jgi:hypothetical protein